LCLIAAAGGTALGYGINSWTTPENTEIKVLIDANFGVTIKDGETLIDPFDSAYSCAALGMMSLKIDWDDHDAIYDYLKANPTTYMTEDNVDTISGGTWHTFAVTEEMVSEEFFGFSGTPSVDAHFDSNFHIFDLCHYVVIYPMFYVIVYIDGSPEGLSFTFQSVIDFMDAMSGSGVNYAMFSATQFLKGSSYMAITELIYDEVSPSESLLAVTFNGASMQLPVANI
jgi:hypothetical protein